MKNVFEKGRKRRRTLIGIDQIGIGLNDLGNELIDGEEFKGTSQNIRCESIDLLEYR